MSARVHPINLIEHLLGIQKGVLWQPRSQTQEVVGASLKAFTIPRTDDNWVELRLDNREARSLTSQSGVSS